MCWISYFRINESDQNEIFNFDLELDKNINQLEKKEEDQKKDDDLELISKSSKNLDLPMPVNLKVAPKIPETISKKLEERSNSSASSKIPSSPVSSVKSEINHDLLSSSSKSESLQPPTRLPNPQKVLIPDKILIDVSKSKFSKFFADQNLKCELF